MNMIEILIEIALGFLSLDVVQFFLIGAGIIMLGLIVIAWLRRLGS
jgi:hypothetical protein